MMTLPRLDGFFLFLSLRNSYSVVCDWTGGLSVWLLAEKWCWAGGLLCWTILHGCLLELIWSGRKAPRLRTSSRLSLGVIAFVSFSIRFRFSFRVPWTGVFRMNCWLGRLPTLAGDPSRKVCTQSTLPQVYWDRWNAALTLCVLHRRHEVLETLAPFSFPKTISRIRDSRPGCLCGDFSYNLSHVSIMGCRLGRLPTLAGDPSR